MIGGEPQGPYLAPGEWHLFLGYRGLNSERHYRGGDYQEEIRSGVVNSQHLLTVHVSHALTRQLNLSLEVPIAWNGFSLLRPLPADPAVRVRQAVRARGIGDVALQGRYWLLNTEKNPNANIALELGFKFPTGNAGVRDNVFNQLVPVDQSIQPGDSGFGFSAGVQAFRTRGDFTLYFQGAYLFNPRNTSGVNAFFSALNNRKFENSVPDQFLLRAGVVHRIEEFPGLALSLGYRLEGVPVRDAIGDSDGFRRPGLFGFIEPGIIFTRGRETWSLLVPVTVYINVRDNPNTTRIEDATVAPLMVLVGYGSKL